MARKVTAMDVRMAAALAQGVDDVAGFCRAQGISRQTYYKWKKRFEREGLDGLRDRKRRPQTIPLATPDPRPYSTADRSGCHQPGSTPTRSHEETSSTIS